MSTADPEPTSRLAWLLPPLLLAAAAGGVALVLREPTWLLGVLLTVAIGAVFLWVLVSSLTPATADRACPACGEPRLVRLDPASTTGVRCEACGHRDAARSSFYLAEEEGSLEELVLAHRRGRRG